ncbi:hypothetical protein FO440_02630 [Mucilaginibacter corticis]|uniref:DUF7336 domain-containing protein n=1 Tax=Mucilaginibacter corticis TaxID=2597670 RepID=A0A556MTE0_9SPHI|nr:hypothetical protein [Mucilaginibacter corticis]TSJ43102.1 hypothetical protein FO440_02630 [Mucilaginibacter corticis]
MTKVYLLYHTHFDKRLISGEDVKLIGVYSSEEKAKAAQARTETLPGFKDAKAGFEITINIIDKDEWTSGFITA